MTAANIGGPDHQIVFCPKHAAAADLLAMCKRLVAENVDTPGEVLRDAEALIARCSLIYRKATPEEHDGIDEHRGHNHQQLGHTPGPWKAACQWYRNGQTHTEGAHWWIVGPNDVTVGMDERTCKEASANARLMASAPSLLAALRVTLPSAIRFSDDPRVDVARCLLDQMDAEKEGGA